MTMDYATDQQRIGQLQGVVLEQVRQLLGSYLIALTELAIETQGQHAFEQFMAEQIRLQSFTTKQPSHEGDQANHEHRNNGSRNL